MSLSDRDWFEIVISDWSKIPDFLDHFENQYMVGKEEVNMKGLLEKASQKLPVIIERRFTQLQILNAALEHFNIHLEKTRSEHYKKFLESYNRALSSRDAEKYVDGVQEVVDIREIVNRIALLRNMFVSLTKAIDAKAFQINNIVKLRAAGLDDAKIE